MSNRLMQAPIRRGVLSAVLVVVFVVLSAATFSGVASAGDGDPVVTEIHTVAPDVLAVVFRQGMVERRTVAPYVAQPGDRIQRDSGGKREAWVIRRNRNVGSLIGPKGDLFASFDRLVGRTIPEKWLMDPGSFGLKSPNDPDYAESRVPTIVFRKSIPTDFAQTGPWDFKYAIEHRSYLKLAKPLKEGSEYTLSFGDRFPAQTFTWRPESQRSEAVHVTHLGFRADDIAKVAFLSCWLGNGGGQAYREGLAFHVIDASTGKRALSGRTVLSLDAAGGEDAYNTNYNGTDVYKMDLAALKTPGTYRVFVEGIGCSYPFTIADDVWTKAFTLTARGFYHQRSGIALGPPYTDFVRPRNFHPEDGVMVYESTTGLMDSGNGLNALGTDHDNFGNLVKGATDKPVANAWGGYFDAGDWDRRIQHLDATRELLELFEMFPAKLERVGLNIPESGNRIPDIIDEALWNLDCYRRMQLPDGGIRGGIESDEHPKYGERSWENSLRNLAYAPDAWSSYTYAGVAARAALLLPGYDKALADAYAASAKKAMEWAEREYARLTKTRETIPYQVDDVRNLAAVELYRLTGEKGWHNLFLETTAFSTYPSGTSDQNFNQGHAAFIYARLKGRAIDKEIQGFCRMALVSDGDAEWAQCQRTAFRWTKPNPWIPVWNAATPKVQPLIRAHFITGIGMYLRGAILGTQYAVGANPMNMSMTTGMGHTSPKNPLWLDFLATGQAPPPGIPVYGPMATDKFDTTHRVVKGAVYPADGWPAMEAYFDIFWIPGINEFTVMETMGPTTYAFGYLAFRK